MLKQALPRIKEHNAGKRLVIACCYPEVLQDDPDLNLVSIADAIQTLGKEKVEHQMHAYRWAQGHAWKGSLVDAMAEMNK